MTPPIRTLIIEDSPVDAELMILQLARSGLPVDVVQVDNAPDFLAALDSPPDLILADWSLPQFSGLRALQLTRERGLDIPFIIVSGRIGEEAAISALRQGAYDYVLKDRLAPLAQSVRHALEDRQLRRERSAAESAQRESEQRYRLLVEMSPDAIGLCDVTGRLMLLNQPAAAMFRYATPDDMAGGCLWDLVAAEERPRTLDLFHDMLDRGAAWREECAMMRRDGGRFMGEISANLLRGDSGDPRAIIIAIRDITERKQHERELEAVAALSAALRAANARAEMSPIILDQLMFLLDAQGAALEMLEADTGELHTVLGRGIWERVTGTSIPPGAGLSAEVLATERACLNNDAAHDPRLFRPDLFADCRAAAGAPLVADGRIIGLLWIGARRELNDRDLRLLTATSDIAANALHRATLHEQTQERLRHLEALHTIDQAITASADLQVTLDVVLAQCLAQLKADAAVVLLLDPVASVMVYATGRGFRGRGIEQTRVRIGEGHAGQAALERRTVGISDLLAAPGFSRAPLVAGEEFTTYHVAPLVAKGKVRGVLETYHRAAFRPSAEWLNLFETLAGQAAIAVDNAQLFEGLQRSNLELSQAYDATIEGWSRAMDLRDAGTEGHSQRVADFTVRMARAMGVAEDQIVHARRGALLHDMGKMGVPDPILQKSGPLSEADWRIMRRHPSMAWEMLSPIGYLRPALDIPYCHHERWDGTGYPRGLKGQEIPLAARIFSVVDVWDALTNDRPYRPAWSRAKALAYIREQSGAGFDPQVVDVFLPVIGDAT